MWRLIAIPGCPVKRKNWEPREKAERIESQKSGRPNIAKAARHALFRALLEVRPLKSTTRKP
jgi:hypothetical protein